MSFTDHQVRQLLGKLDRIATALERLADNHGAPRPSKPDAAAALPRAVHAHKPDLQF